MEYSSLAGYSVLAPERRRPDRGEQEPKPSPPNAATRPQLMAAVLGGGLAVGVALRVAYFFSGRSLWIDEARLALNGASRSYRDLLRPLDYDQAAPPLFLWAEKLMTQLLGVHERAFWLLPFICGIGAMLLFVPLARRFLPGWPGVLAAASGSVAPTLMHYSAVAKPYMGDLTVALAVMVATGAWIDRADSRLG